MLTIASAQCDLKHCGFSNEDGDFPEETSPSSPAIQLATTDRHPSAVLPPMAPADEESGYFKRLHYISHHEIEGSPIYESPISKGTEAPLRNIM